MSIRKRLLKSQIFSFGLQQMRLLESIRASKNGNLECFRFGSVSEWTRLKLLASEFILMLNLMTLSSNDRFTHSKSYTKTDDTLFSQSVFLIIGSIFDHFPPAKPQPILGIWTDAFSSFAF